MAKKRSRQAKIKAAERRQKIATKQILNEEVELSVRQSSNDTQKIIKTAPKKNNSEISEENKLIKKDLIKTLIVSSIVLLVLLIITLIYT